MNNCIVCLNKDVREKDVFVGNIYKNSDYEGDCICADCAITVATVLLDDREIRKTVLNAVEAVRFGL